ncbi:hypothetical protein [Catenuloplanes japonicus]|uniref:hypothetical protein n=1 Tax=Catenuloplanes japonicus TaxID=33876 RepID=UPI000525A541|nr:hypothetical protein [Catenuloplanes japonicus]
MGPNDAVTRRPPVQEGEIIDADGEPAIPPSPPVTPTSNLIGFLDNRWRYAESSDAAARRAILLLTSTIAAAALALVLLTLLLVLVGLLVGLMTEHLPSALLALIPFVTGGGVAITIYRRQR